MASSKKYRKLKKQQSRLLRELKRINKDIITQDIQQLEIKTPTKKKIEKVKSVTQKSVDVSRETLPRFTTKKVQQTKFRQAKAKARKINKYKPKATTKVHKTRSKKVKTYLSSEELHKIRVESGKKAYQTKISKFTPQELALINKQTGERLQKAKKKKREARIIEEIQKSANYQINFDIEIEDDFNEPTHEISPIDYSVIEGLEQRFKELELMQPISKYNRNTKRVEFFSVSEYGLVSDFNDIVSEWEERGQLELYITWLYENENEIASLVDKILEPKYIDEAVGNLQLLYTLIQGSPVDIVTALNISKYQDSINGE